MIMIDPLTRLSRSPSMNPSHLLNLFLSHSFWIVVTKIVLTYPHIRKKHPSPEPLDRTDPHVKHEVSTNGGWVGPSQYSRHASFSSLSPKSPDNDEFYDDHEAETLDYRYSISPFFSFFFYCWGRRG